MDDGRFGVVVFVAVTVLLPEAEFVSHETLSPYEQVVVSGSPDEAPAQEKQWTVRNSGKVAWQSDTVLMFNHGNPLGSPFVVALDSQLEAMPEPNDTAVVKVLACAGIILSFLSLC